MKLLETMLSEPIGILSLIVVVGSIAIIGFLAVWLTKQSSGSDNKDN
jgi:hypothetical protein